MSQRHHPPITIAPPDRLPYMPGIDGLRAIAVIAVVLYHADIPWLPGGFLGVDVFFVISGYLITSLLLLEWRRSGRVALSAFWVRRFRRLLPALFTVLIVTSLFAMLFVRDAVYRLAADVTAALTYSTNWFLIVRGESYFEAFSRPPLLRHLWSLAVEEQFYLFWPLVFAAIAIFIGSRRGFTGSVKVFLSVIVAAIIGSTVLMAVSFTPFEDPSRLYFGTDARVHVILVGALLAFVWQPWRFRGQLGRFGRTALTGAGLAALGGLAAILALSSEYGAFLYRGGFLVTALVTAVIIAVTVHPQIRLGALVGSGSLRWVGTRSYGIYLWHWPIFIITRPGVDVPFTWSTTFVVRLLLTFALAEASYRWIERPIRRHGFGAWLRSITVPVRRTAPQVAMVLPALGLVFVAGLMIGLIAGHGAGPSNLELTAAGPDQPADARATTTAATTSTTSTTAPAAAPSTSIPLPTTTTIAIPPRPTITTVAHPPPPASPIIFIGDSVMLGATDELRSVFGEDTYVDATVSRQLKQIRSLMEDLNAGGSIGDTVVLHVGTNGLFSSETFDDLMATLRDIERVFFLTISVPRRYEGAVNAALAAGTERWDNAALIDWKGFVDENGDVVGGDSTHLTGAGRSMYAEFIREAIEP